MAIILQKGQKINLSKDDGHQLTNFCVGCNWGAIEEEGPKKFFGLFSGDKKIHNVDLDLSSIMIDAEGNLFDHIYSPLYREDFLKYYGLPLGKVDSIDGALHHSGDDVQGDTGGDDNLDNEIITVDLTKINPRINQIFFFLNNCGNEDFSMIPYASIRMYEGTIDRVQKIFAQYNVASSIDFRGKKSVIMGKLYKRNNMWKFAAIGDAYDDSNIGITIKRILQNYVR